MALKLVLDSLDGVHESVKDAYTERDGKFHLTVDGLVPKARLDEFRDTNVARARENDELKKTLAGFADVDVEKYRAMTARETGIAEKKLIEAGKVEELFEARLAPMRAEHDKVVKGLASEKGAAVKQLEGLLIDSALRDAATKAGVLPTAVTDVLLRGRQVFRLSEGKATAFDGDAPVFGKDGQALGMSEWATSLSDTAPHMFALSQGGGTPKGGSATGATGAKTMTRAQYDAIPHMDRAAAMKGVTLTD